MKLKTVTKNLIITLILCGMGVILPFISGMFGLEQVLLTMQIPILIAGFVLPMNWAVTCAILTPVLNGIILGTPTIYPVLPIMLCQLIALAASCNMLRGMTAMKIYPILLFSILLGWVLFFCAASIISWILDDVNAFSYTREVLSLGWPGIILQIAVVPPIVKLLDRRIVEWRGE